MLVSLEIDLRLRKGGGRSDGRARYAKTMAMKLLPQPEKGLRVDKEPRAGPRCAKGEVHDPVARSTAPTNIAESESGAGTGMDSSAAAVNTCSQGLRSAAEE